VAKREWSAEMKRYRIVVRGEFGELLSNAFADFRIETGQGETVLTADVVDSSQLYGILDRLRDFAVEVVRFREVATTGPAS
jgi:hypothetical protein